MLRPAAAAEVLTDHIPADRQAARAWLDQQEAADRKNARVIDKLMLALPVELSPAQRAELVRRLAMELGRGRIPWLAAVHDRGEDAHNPHAHVILRDRDIETGKRVAGLSEKGSTDRIRATWERLANEALAEADQVARIDRRRLAAQGIEREPGIHVGAACSAMEQRGERPESQPRHNARRRLVEWPRIDAGRTRGERQREIVEGIQSGGKWLRGVIRRVWGVSSVHLVGSP